MRIVIAEDSTLLRAGLVSLLAEEGHEVTGVGDAQALLSRLAAEQPDLAIVDVRLPPDHTDEGVRAALDIRRRWPRVGICILSQYIEQEHTARLIGGDARGIGYLLKDRVASVVAFSEALERIASGGIALDPEVVQQLLRRTTRTDPLATLTARERDVLDQLAQGRTNAGIAKTLYLSTSAVEKHIATISDKLDLTSAGGYNRRVLAVLRYLQG